MFWEKKRKLLKCCWFSSREESHEKKISFSVKFGLGVEAKKERRFGLARGEAARRFSLSVVVVFWLSVVSMYSCTTRLKE